MPPIDITFHFTPPTSRNHTHNTKRLIATNSRLPTTTATAHPVYFTVDKNKHNHHKKTTTTAPAPAALPISTPSPQGTVESSLSSQSSSSTPTTTNEPSQSKRRKGPVYIYPTPLNDAKRKTASLTPLLKPIVARCSASTGTGKEEYQSYTLPSSPRKKHSNGSGNGKSKNTSVWPIIHPYSRSTDLANTRSSIPSPKEVARAQRLEEEKARAKKENAALARAAVAAKRKTKPKGQTQTRSGSKKRSESPNRPLTLSPEKKDKNVPIITTEPASIESSPRPVLSPSLTTAPSFPSSRPMGGLKRTRSQGVLPISTALGAGVGVVSVSSPLKAVLGINQDDNDVGPSRKRSKLIGEDTDQASPSSARRATTHSPVGTPPSLPDESPQIPHTFPLPAAKVLPSRQNATRASSIAPSSSSIGKLGEGDGTSMRRVVSAGMGTGSKRAGSFSSDGSGRERLKREVNLPNRLRDYDIRVDGPVV